MKRKPAPKSARPAYTITEALTEKERESHKLSQWKLTASNGKTVHIVHRHDEDERAVACPGAWYEVFAFQKDRQLVHSRDFAAAITAALDLIGGAK